MKIIFKYLKKYLPDLLFLIGIYIFSINFFSHTKGAGLFSHTIVNEGQVLGVMFVTLAIDIAIRRYFRQKK